MILPPPPFKYSLRGRDWTGFSQKLWLWLANPVISFRSQNNLGNQFKIRPTQMEAPMLAPNPWQQHVPEQQRQCNNKSIAELGALQQMTTSINSLQYKDCGKNRKSYSLEPCYTWRRSLVRLMRVMHVPVYHLPLCRYPDLNKIVLGKLKYFYWDNWLHFLSRQVSKSSAQKTQNTTFICWLKENNHKLNL